MLEQANKGELSASSRIQSSGDVRNDKEREHMLDKQTQFLRTNVIDVFGKETEPICDYLQCRHKFSEHGLRMRKCQCNTST